MLVYFDLSLLMRQNRHFDLVQFEVDLIKFGEILGQLINNLHLIWFFFKGQLRRLLNSNFDTRVIRIPQIIFRVFGFGFFYVFCWRIGTRDNFGFGLGLWFEVDFLWVGRGE